MVKINLKKSKKTKNEVVTEAGNDSIPSVATSSIGTTQLQPSIATSSIGTTPVQLAEVEAVDSTVSTELVFSISSRKRSWVWEHFTEYVTEKIIKCKGKPDQIVTNRRAKCKYCPKGKLGDYAVESEKNGTGGMNKHINKTCRYFPGRKLIDKNQKTLVGDKTSGNKMRAHIFKPEEVMQACVEMIVIDELPFSFVDKLGFRKFCRVASPDFQVPSKRTLVTNFLALYENKKKQVCKTLRKYRVCLTTDTWTNGPQNINYMVLTAHFVDDNWVLHKRVINFCTIHNHSGNSIGKLIEECLLKWGITKVLTITVDNAAANKCALEYVTARLNKVRNAQPILQGKYMHMRCTAHICNLIVGSGLKMLNKAVLGIRNAVKFVRSSPHRLDIFKSNIAKEKIACRGLVVMDVPTRWNSTFLMLEAGLKFRAAFARMGEDEECYRAYFQDPDEEFDEEGKLIISVPDKPKRGKCGPPSEEDWENAEVFMFFLKVFYDVTKRVSASTRATIHTTFHDVLSIETEISKLSNPSTLQIGGNTKKILADMAKEMKEKFAKYYHDSKQLNPFMYVGVILDPRYKLVHLTHLFTLDGYGKEDVVNRTKVLKDFMMSLYEEYVLPEDVAAVNQQLRQSQSTTSSGTAGTGSRAEIINRWNQFVSSTNVAVPTHEVDKYLEDSVEISTDENYPILDWWKLNAVRYPVLARISKDVMAIQVSSVASESAFSTGGRVVNDFRSSLTPKSVEALVCLQSWLRGNDVSSIEDIPNIKDIELYEQVEREHASSLEITTQTVEVSGNESVDVEEGESDDEDGGSSEDGSD